MDKNKIRCTNDGKPPIDPDAPGAPGPIDPITGQHTQYWVLCEEERAKGFVRPYRDSYKHVGLKPQYPLRELTEEEKERFERYKYVAFEVYPEERSPITGRFYTEEQLNSGCGTITTMGNKIAETYARDPEFYGSTFCCGCNKHIPVEEFVWVADGEVVGS